jgi:hypothetical protein
MNAHIETDDLTDTGVIRFQVALNVATARFVSHFTRDLKTDEPADLEQVAA